MISEILGLLNLNTISIKSYQKIYDVAKLCIVDHSI